MSYKLQNNSNYDLSQLTSLVQEYYPYAKKSMGFGQEPVIIFESDLENAKNPLGKTAYYNPSDYSVTIYVDNRHPKDIMRSLNHELVHHTQNCAGKFENLGPTEEGYAQSDPYLREMEEEAYKDMTFRDWENQRNIKEKKTMKLTEEKLREIIKEAIQKALGEQSKTDSPDRVGGRDAGGRRLDEEDEENLEESEEEAGEDKEKKEREAQDKEFYSTIAGAQSGVTESEASEEEVTESYIEDRAYARDEDKEVEAKNLEEAEEEEIEEDKEPAALKEWYGDSLFSKLLKEYTKR